MRAFPTTNPPLQAHDWPYVAPYDEATSELEVFLAAQPAARSEWLDRVRPDPDAHGAAVHGLLASAYAHVFGYADSPRRGRAEDRFESELAAAKIRLERELADVWIPAQRAWRPDTPGGGPHDQRALADALRRLATDNPGVNHPLYDYLAEEASADALRVFLHNEVIRNEVVDDEVALLAVGTQGLMKSAVATNLFDECGRGRLDRFHTYWLRLLLEELGWDDLRRYRRGRPWFAGVTSNVFTMLLTRPAYRPAAYGHFLITEGWVPPHFEKVLAGMRRHGLGARRRDVYFTAHVRLDPTHTEELILGLESQSPALEPWQCEAVERGTRMAVAGAVTQYDRMLAYLRTVDG